MLPRIELARPPSPRVSVIVPAGGSAELLLACLGALARNGPAQIPFETIVVLNAPTPGTLARLETEVAGATLVASPVNLGLAGAGNRGRSLARGELLVLLHDDAEIEPGWLEALLAAAEERPDAGAIGGCVLHPDGRLQNAGMILWRDGRASDAWAGTAPAPSAFAARRAVDYCGTSSLLVRARSWDDVGGLDERFFPAYYVDVDLALALRQRGQTVLYEPGSRIRHRRAASSSPRFRRFVSTRNRALLLAKWGAALTDHEPAEPGSAPAVGRAIARAAAAGERLRGSFVPPSGAAVAPPPLDAALQERRSLTLALELERAYASELESELDGGLTARPAHPTELAELRARAAVLDQIERSRLWRLYRRLLPLLRRLRRRRAP